MDINHLVYETQGLGQTLVSHCPRTPAEVSRVEPWESLSMSLSLAERLAALCCLHLQLKSTVNQGKKSRQECGGKIRCRCQGAALVTGLPLMAYVACLLTAPRTTNQGVVLPTVSLCPPSTHITNQENAPQANRVGSFLS